MTPSDGTHPALVVGIGASAGGLAAFKGFLSQTPADTGMTFVLVQHLDPHHKSLLVELLGAQSPIPVVAATDGAAVKENCVFVIPPDATLTIKDGVLQVATPAPAREFRRPIDTFFVSLAEDCGERAVGIVLAGVGSDGTIGIGTIKEHGGLTLAQAEFDATALQGMPSSAAATGLVDHVVAVEAMPGKLIDYATHLVGVAEKKDGDGQRSDLQQHLAKITSLLHARSAHDFSGYKDATLIRRLQRRMQVLHIESATDYVARLKTDRGEIEALFRELLIGVTQFFRDPEAFDALKATAILPLLAAKDEGEPIRVWVPGCSTGEEVYSLAIVLREALRARDRVPQVTIFGTDIDANAVATARFGRYPKAASGLSPERFERWFARDGDDYCPVPEIRDMCVFSTHSLVRDPPFSKLDLISCRNVLIYLGEELQDRLMRTFHYALLPGGTLFLGTSESVTRSSRLFTALDKKHRILQRRDAGATLPALQPTGHAALEPPPASVRRRSAEDRIDKAVSHVMQHYAPAYFVIDRNHEVTRFSGAETGPYLEPSKGAASLSLFSIVHKTLRPAVRAAVNQAVASGQRVINETLTLRIDGEARALTLIVEPVAGQNGKTSGSCVVAFRDTSPRAAGGAPEAPAAESDAHVQLLEREIAATRAQLEAATDDLETQIEDMKSTTEEFQSVNEELQSSNEELETAKEEMQSVNEELHTINSELNNKNELLTRLNSDMQNLLESTQIATVFLDGQLRIKHFTPTLSQLFPVRDSDRGRPITDILSGLAYTELQGDVDTVQRNGTIVERDLALKDGAQTFVMRIRPYRTVKGEIDGVVITFVDITERKRAEELRANLAAIVESSDDAIIGKDLDGIINSWNQGAQRLFGYTAQEAVGQPASILIPSDREDEEPRILERISRGESTHNYETVRQRKDGSLFDISLTVSPIRDAQGRVIGASKIMRDITERKQAEETRRLALDASGAGVWVWHAATGVSVADEAYRALYGFGPEEVIDDATWAARLHPDDRDPHMRLVEACLKTGGEWQEEFRIIHPVLGERCLAGRGKVLRDTEGRVTSMTGINFDVTVRKTAEAAVAAVRQQAEETQRLLIDELNHRVKNTLAIVQAMAEQTLQKARDPAHFVDSFRGRLHALSRAHNLLTQRSWRGVDLESLVREQLVVDATQGERITCSGPELQLLPRVAVHLGLTLHELGTNARKYGALKVSEGRLSVTWRVTGQGSDHFLELNWAESGGPTVSPPAVHGFGTVLIERGLKHSLGGTAHMNFAPTGVMCDIRLPLPETGDSAGPESGVHP